MADNTTHVRYVHRVSPKASDTADVVIPDGAWTDRKALAAALRRAGVLAHGQRIVGMRTEGDHVVVFPSYGIWHSIVLYPPSSQEKRVHTCGREYRPSDATYCWFCHCG